MLSKWGIITNLMQQTIRLPRQRGEKKKAGSAVAAGEASFLLTEQVWKGRKLTF
jgi:hypothetical protein